jgi:hypothetical protein
LVNLDIGFAIILFTGRLLSVVNVEQYLGRDEFDRYRGPLVVNHLINGEDIRKSGVVIATL